MLCACSSVMPQALQKRFFFGEQGEAPSCPVCSVSCPGGREEPAKLRSLRTYQNSTRQRQSKSLSKQGERRGGLGTGDCGPRWTRGHSSGEGLVTRQGQTEVTPKPPGPLGMNIETRSLSNGIY